jgi:hypothetical protein
VSEKVFDMWHRKLITKYNRRVARLSTTNDVTSSSEYRYMAKDEFITIYNRGYRLLRKISQKTLRKTLFLGNSLSDSYYSNVRNSKYVRENLQLLVDIGILKKNIDINYISNNTLGNLVSISYFLQEIDK